MIWAMGELLVEIMRPTADVDLYTTGVFAGPFASGAPAIFADTVAKLGYPAGMIGSVGEDDFGKCITDRLQQDGVDCSLVSKHPTLSTGVAFVTYTSDGDRNYIFHLGNSAAGTVQAPTQIKDAEVLHLMGCSLTSSTEMYQQILETVKLFVAQGAKLSFDPNIRKEMLHGQRFADFIQPILAHCEVILPGVEELLDIAEKDSVEEAVKALFTLPKLQVIALKKGSQGSTIYTRDGQFDCGIYPVEVQDATGAGDSFDAAFMVGYQQGLPLQQCAQMAAAAASLNTAAFGPMEGKITPESMLEMMGN